jgi:hypothetical protein
MNSDITTEASRVEPLLRLAVTEAQRLGWTIVRDTSATLSSKKKTCCPFGACQAVAGEGTDTFTVLGVLEIGMTWASEFTMGFDNITPPNLYHRDAYALGKQMAKEYL